MATQVRVEGQDWNVEKVAESGSKLLVTLVGGQVIATSGATAATVKAALEGKKRK